MNTMKWILYAGAVVAGLIGLIVLIAALSFQSGLSNALLPLRMAGMGMMLDLILPPIAQGVAVIGVVLFFIMAGITLLLVVAGRLIGRSITLEDRVRALEAKLEARNL